MQRQNFLNFLFKIRLAELNNLIPYFTPEQVVVEIGGGTGWQARQLARHGIQVISIDVQHSNYVPAEYPVIPYDGFVIPLASHSADIVFSSNVLEHIPHVQEYQTEILRILKPGGKAIHLMPTPHWRFWTTVAHYIRALEIAYRNVTALSTQKTKRPSPIQLVKDIRWFYKRHFLISRHGEIGNILTEYYYFSAQRWIKLFQSAEWEVKSVISGGLFYTGYFILGAKLGMTTREKLSHILGSACNIYILQKPS
jgi:2-polyprenyl-3-methyl-5-hydroxy-6-metoxy-1,4-benzoquinol methylase